jgi:hypothetical protein
MSNFLGTTIFGFLSGGGGGGGATPITGSGAVGQVAYFTNTNEIGGSNNLFWDSTNDRLGIGNAIPTERLDVTGVVRSTALTVAGGGTFTAGATNGNINVGANLGVGLAVGVNPNNKLQVAGNIRLLADLNEGIFGTSAAGAAIFAFGRINTPSNASLGFNTLGGFNFGVGNAVLGSTSNMVIYGTGNVVIQNGGVFADTGQRLKVVGNVQITGNLSTTTSVNTMTGSGSTSATSVLTLANSTPAQMFRFRNDGVMILGSNDTITIKPFSTNPANVDLAGSNLSFRNNPLNAATTDGTFNFSLGAAMTITSGIAVGVGMTIGFSPGGGTAEFNVLAITSTINQTGGANGITRALYIQPTLTSAAAFRAIETTNSLGFAAYFGGTAPIFFNGGANIQFDTATGSKIGSATNQKLAFWNATPIVQPTTAVASATYVAVGGGNVQLNDTFDGYTIAKVVKAIRNIGLLA